MYACNKDVCGEECADLHELAGHDGLLVLLAEVEGAVVQRLVVVLLQHLLPPLVQVL